MLDFLSLIAKLKLSKKRFFLKSSKFFSLKRVLDLYQMCLWKSLQGPEIAQRFMLHGAENKTIHGPSDGLSASFSIFIEKSLFLQVS